MQRATPIQPPGPLKVPKARGRTTRRNRGEMNQTERRYHDEVLMPALGISVAVVDFERITLLLAPDTRYTPDFFVLKSDALIEFHEVKGFMEDDAWVKLKVAAQAYPWFTFVLARARAKKHGGGWEIKTIGGAE